MFRFFTIVSITLITTNQAFGQRIDSFFVFNDVKVTIDRPPGFKAKKTVVVFFALPNGNSTVQTMGKKMQPGDDWHFDIQHIRAQTEFLRQEVKKTNWVVIYLENNYKSWPAWKQKHTDFKKLIPHLIDSLADLIEGTQKEICLNGHSGGGSFIFGYLAAVDEIPNRIKRISFLDSNYGYDSSYLSKIKKWLTEVKGADLNVFAYNDSIALYNGKPVVSATGGTWYRGHLMLRDLQSHSRFNQKESDSLITYENNRKNIHFYFKKNFNRGIYHTQQVELNGFIHSLLCGTKHDSHGYMYYGARSYSKFIR